MRNYKKTGSYCRVLECTSFLIRMSVLTFCSLYVETFMKKLKEQIERDNSCDLLNCEINNTNIREKEENTLIRRSCEMNDIALQLRNDGKRETISNKQKSEQLIVRLNQVQVIFLYTILATSDVIKN